AVTVGEVGGGRYRTDPFGVPPTGFSAQARQPARRPVDRPRPRLVPGGCGDRARRARARCDRVRRRSPALAVAAAHVAVVGWRGWHDPGGRPAVLLGMAMTGTAPLTNNRRPGPPDYAPPLAKACPPPSADAQHLPPAPPPPPGPRIVDPKA